MYFYFLFLLNFFLFFQPRKCDENSVNKPEINELLVKNVAEMNPHANLEQLITDILYLKLRNMKCFALICDNMYKDIFTIRMFKKLKTKASYYVINVDDSEDLLSPYNETQEALNDVKTEGCTFYIILLANGHQVSRFLRFGDRYRVLNTRANFIMLYDMRLFQKNLHYLWTRIVNVIFIREYTSNSQSKTSFKPWFDLSTVPFPSPILGVFIPHRLDIWQRGHFRKGINLFRDKTSNLKSQTLKVVTFQHIPSMVKTITSENNSDSDVSPVIYSGLEIEILQTLADQMNFETNIYEPENADFEKWGRKQDGKFTGLLGEMVKFKAEIALGDLYYSPYHLELMDLSIPFNTECLTFLTPESSTDNSWMTLILPFKLYMWLTVILVIFIVGFIFHFLAVWHRFLYESSQKTSCIVFESKTFSADANIFREKLNSPFKHLQIHKRRIQLVETEEEPVGLYLFEDYFNSFLYTYSMLLLISLPKVPDGWSLRMLVGWYFLYTTLVVVSYKASMTAILANPAPKITIDTLEGLYESDLACGGWSETVKNFFLTSLDPAGQKIGEKFEQVNDSDSAVERVAKGDFAYYENIYYLKALSVKRQLLVQLQKTQQKVENNDRNLHIMSNCVINMPISIGLQKNSPIKPKIDTFIRRVIEGGFVKKWLNDVMQPTLTSEMNIDPETTNDLMTLRKLYAGIVALFIGYFLSSVALGIELAYWKYVVIKNPYFDKYSNSIYVPIHKEIIVEEL